MLADLGGEREHPTGTEAEAGESIRWGPVIRVCGTLVVGVGLIVLLGWGLGHPLLASLGTGTIPVAPSTAVLLLLYALALSLRLSRQPRRNRVGSGIIWGGAFISTLLLICSLLGVHPDAEHLGLTIVDLPGQPPIGHMSLVTAVFFLLAALSYLASLPKTPTATWGGTMAFCLAGLLTGVNALLVLAYLYGTPLFYGGSFIPPAVLTCLAFMALGVALLALAAPVARIPGNRNEPTARTTALFTLTFALLATGIVSAGFLSFRAYETRFRAEVEAQLSAIAELKGSELAHWRRERLMDAATLYRNEAHYALVRRFFADPGDAEAARQLKAGLDSYRPLSSPYEALFLLDGEGQIRLAATSGARLMSGLTPPRVSAILAEGRVVFQDFVLDPLSRRISLAILVPIMDESAEGRAIGLLVLQVDPDTYLYPVIAHWPGASRTAETLLVRREGNEVLVLNEHKSGREEAMARRFSIGQSSLPAVQAVLGQQGIVEGRDQRGVEVIADLRAVPDSPWHLVSLIEKTEVYAPLRERLWLMVAFVGALLLGAAASVGLIWRQQRIRIYRAQLAAAESLRLKSAEIEARNAEMERFTYTVSHDLKSPLVTIKTFLGYLEQDMAKADQQRIAQDLGYMQAAVDKMRQLLDELLEMSRVGRVVNPPVTTPFHELVDEALRAVAGSLAARGVVVEVAPAPLSLHGDRPRLVEVWQNLIENAVKYMGGQESPRIEIGVRTEGGKTAFYVRDNGIGIDPRHQGRVFGLFDKLDPKSEGSGLGLALVKRIVELYDGAIWLESAGPGQGACFWFTVPKAVVEGGGL